ncbi:hypothetical protein DYH09_09140 [bacterium CPR1]|nr:hypothetical protein [bacterium CPR1]
MAGVAQVVQELDRVGVGSRASVLERAYEVYPALGSDMRSLISWSCSGGLVELELTALAS